jgi:hypothetical protein
LKKKERIIVLSAQERGDERHPLKVSNIYQPKPDTTKMGTNSSKFQNTGRN